MDAAVISGLRKGILKIILSHLYLDGVFMTLFFFGGVVSCTAVVALLLYNYCRYIVSASQKCKNIVVFQCYLIK